MGDFAAVLGVLAALWGLYKGIVEFALQGRQKRAEMFLKKQGEYFANTSFQRIRQLLENDDALLQEIPFEEKRAYLTFFEEIAVLKNSGLINADLTYYMFGYYAAKCLESRNFWSDLNKADIFWMVFMHFSTQMQTRLRSKCEVVIAAYRILISDAAGSPVIHFFRVRAAHLRASPMILSVAPESASSR